MEARLSLHGYTAYWRETLINTLLIQDLLSEPEWKEKLTADDVRALTPLIYNHINPYGIFVLDMSQRLPLKTVTLAV